jgi:flagellar basal-body rod protein FlgB
MTSPILNDTAFRSLSFALDGLSRRQEATANNIANADTPGFKAQRVEFENELRSALGSQTTAIPEMKITHANHLGYSPRFDSGRITTSHDTNTLRNDDNNVDVDLEMTTLAETSMRYRALTQLTGMKISLIKSIIQGK